jgi:signal peptidase I
VHTRKTVKVAALIASAAIFVLAWYALAPRQLGGRMSYVTTSGTSMQPLLHAGDLVVVRSGADYTVGDVAAYHNADLGQVVLHRIVAIDGDRYVFKGDHNDWLDGYEPTSDDLIGEMSMRVPGIGSRLEAARSPLGMAALAGVTTFGVLGRRRRSRRGRTRDRQQARRADAPSTSPGSPRRRSSGAGHAVAGGVLVSLGATALAIGLLASPTTTVSSTTSFDEIGTFRYAGDGGSDAAAVYGHATITTGEPVYRQLADEVAFRFRYELRAHGRTIDGDGTASMVAVLADGNGWTRTMPLAPPTSFTGRTVALGGTLDLHEVGRLTEQLERLTGVPGGSYTLRIEPQILFDGELAGASIHRSFAPSLPLIVDPTVMRVAPPSSGTDETPADPSHVQQTDAVHVERTVPRRFGAGGVSVGAGDLRLAGGVVLAVGLVLLFAAAFARARAGRDGEAALIEARFGRWLVPVATRTTTAGPVVEVESFDALRKLAEHYGQVVLHERDGSAHVFSVDENGVTYRYRVTSEGVR